MNTFSISEALAFGWETFKKNVGFFIILVVILGIFQFGVSFLVSWLTGETNVYVNVGSTQYQQTKEGVFAGNPAIVTLLNVISTIISLLISIGMMKIFLDFVDGKKGDLKDLYQQYPLALKYIGASILEGLIVLAGFLFFIIPGIYLAVKLSMTTYVVVDKKAGPIDAIKSSYEITKGNWWNLVFLGVVSGLIAIAGALALLVGLFVAIPVIMIAYAFAYRKLSGSIVAPAPVAAAPVAPAPVAAVPEPTQTPEPAPEPAPELAPAAPTPESTPTTT